MRKFITDILAKTNLGVEQNAYVLGTVGIGTTSPTNAKLVISDSNANKISIAGGSSQNGMRWESVGGANTFYLFNGTFGTAGWGIYNVDTAVAPLWITNAGNVGIGTSSPSSKLHIDGVDPFVRINNVGSANTQGIKISYNYSDTHGFHLLYNANNAASYLDNTYPITSGQPWGDIYFRQNSAGTMLTRMTIKADGGNVGIGTTSPSYKLDVSGTGRFTDNVAINGTLIGTDQTFGGPYRTFAFGTNANGFNRIFAANDTSDGLYLNSATGRGIYFRVNGGGANVVSIESSGAATFSSSVTASSLIKSGGTSSQYLMADGSVSTLTNPVTGTGTTNYIPKWTSGSAIGNSQVFDNGTDVGVGTSSPFVKFDVRGDAILLYRPAANAYAMYSAANNSYSWQFGINNGSDYIIWGGGFTAPGTERFRITSGGNVGIGTSNPFNKLTVGSVPASGYGLITISADWASGTAISTGIKIGAANDTGAAGVDIRSHSNYAATSGTEMSFWTNSTGNALYERMRITNAGNVGIGTTNPYGRLHLTGDYDGAQNTLNLENNWPNTYSTSLINFWAYYNAVNPMAVIEAGQDDSATNAGVIIFKTMLAGAAPSTRMIIRPSGDVGIGTTTPNPFGWASKTLTVVSSATNSYAALEAYGNGTGAGAVLLGNTSILRASIVANDGSNLVFAVNANNTGSSQTERMRITASGYIGVATSSPVTRFTVNAYAGSRLPYINGTANTFDANGITVTSSNTANANIGGGLDLTNNVHSVGSYSPLISFSALSQSGVYNNNYAAIYGVLAGDSGDGNWNTGHIAFATTTAYGASEKVRITSAGNVGIGTADPVEKLQVTNGNISIRNTSGGTWGSLRFGTTNTSYLTEWAGIDSDWEGVGINVANLRFYTSYGSIGERMRITSSGNVGIGTTSPSAKLDVSGVIRSTSDIIGTRFYTPGFAVPSSANGVFNNTNYSGPAWNNASFVTGNGATGVMMGGDAALYSYGWIQGVQTDNGATKGLFLNPLGGNVNVGGATTFSSSVTATSYIASDGGDFGWGNGTTYIDGDSSNQYIRAIVNNSEKLRISPSGNVGIGIASPGYKLHVIGAVGIGQNTNGTATIDAYGGNAYYGCDGTQITVNGNSGNVGIGTTSLGSWAKLQVAGNLAITGSLFSFSDNLVGGQTPAYLDYNYSSGKLIVGSYGPSASGYIVLETGGTEKVRIANNGNVGIGTTSPALKLDVVGGTTNQPVLRLQSTDTDGYTGAHLYSSAGTLTGHFGWANGTSTTLSDKMYFGTIVNKPVVFTTNDTEKVRIAANGNVGIGTSYTDGLISGTEKVLKISNSNIASIYLESVGNGIWANYINAARSLVWYDITADAERMRITSAGNVGIGITNPDTKLDVGFDANNRSIVRLNSNAANRMAGVTFYGNNVESSTIGYEGGSEIVSGGVQGDLVIRNHLTSKNIVLITNGGNVGIGTTSPATKLEVRGTVTFFGDSSFQAGNLVLVDVASGGSTWGIYSGYPSLGDFTIRESGIDNRFVIKKTTGNVGIGTTSPTHKLTVTGDGSGTMKVGGPGVSGNYTGISLNGTLDVSNYNILSSPTDNHLYINRPTGNDIYFRVNNNDQVIINSSGNVGIGTTSPGFKLTVAGGSGDWATKFSSGTASAYFAHSGGYGASIDAGSNATSSTYLLELISNGSTRVYVRGDGNVGIGTTSPSSTYGKLTVAGGISTTDDTSSKLQLGRYSAGIPYSYIKMGTNSNGLRITNPADNEDLFTITSGGNVGIGTTSPTTPLRVEGGGVMTGGWNKNTTLAATYPVLIFNSNASKWAGIGYDHSAGLRVWLNATSDDVNTVTPQFNILNNGNVGIGTTSPSYKLEVNGTFGANGTAVFNGSATYVNSSDIIVGNNSTDTVGISGNTMYFPGNGNVGIGTTSPSAKLHVTGELKLTDAAAAYTFFDQINGTYYSVWYRNNNITYLYDSYLNSTPFVVNSSGNVGIGTTTPTLVNFGRELVISQTTGGQPEAFLAIQGNRTDDNNIGGVNFYNNSNFLASVAARRTGANNSGSLTFNTSNAGTGSERMRITDTGNVGIGTTSPNFKLQVNHGTGAEYVASFRNTNDNLQLKIGTTTGNLLNIQGATISTNAVYNIALQAEGGNVGIGTTSPGGKLEVNTSAANGSTALILRTNDSGANSAIRWQNSGGTNQAGIGSNFNVSDNGALEFINGTTTNMILRSSGNVGIGTTSPSSKLHVYDNSDVWHTRIGGASGELRIGGQTASGAVIQAYTPAGAQRDLYLQRDGGNVGIGTFSPSHKLHVAGGVYSISSGVDGGYIALENSGGGNRWYWAARTDGLNLGQLGVADGRIFVNNSGNVGIGTTSPSYKLNVVATSATDADIFQAGMTGVSNGFSVQRVSSAFKYTFVDGNVGIGTTAPKQRLIVEGIFATKPSEVDGYYSYLRSNWNENDAFELGISENGSSNFHKLITSSNYYFGSTLQFWTADVERIRIISNGNVGIGTASPVTGLDVRTSTYSNTTARFGTSRPVYIINDDPIIGFNQYYNSGWKSGTTGYSGNIGVSSSGEMYFNVSTASVATDNTVTQREVIRILNNGNVGVGTTSPGAKLDVVGSIWLSGRVEGRAFPYNSTFGSGADATTTTLDAGSTNTYRSSIVLAGGSATDPNTIKFLTTSAERMRITSTGNVGIGTTSPAYKIDVAGNSRFVSGNESLTMFQVNGWVTNYINSVLSASAVAHIFGKANSLNNSATLRYYHASDASTSNYMGLGFYGNDDLLRVFADAGVRLTGYGSGTKTGTVAYNLGVTSTGNIIELPGGVVDGSGTANYVTKWIDANTVGNSQIFDNGTSVGIGTTSPTALLTVAGTTDLAWAASTSKLQISRSSTVARLQNYENGSAATSLALQWEGGNVGIGTTSPSYKLHVEGNVSGISIYASHDIAAFSDITVKKEVKRIENAIEKVKELNGYTYVRTDDETGTRRAGVIAQEVQKVLPEVVSANPDGTLNVAYSNMIALLIEGMKEQQATIERLEDRIKQLEK